PLGRGGGKADAGLAERPPREDRAVKRIGAIGAVNVVLARIRCGLQGPGDGCRVVVGLRSNLRLRLWLRLRLRSWLWRGLRGDLWLWLWLRFSLLGWLRLSGLSWLRFSLLGRLRLSGLR